MAIKHSLRPVRRPVFIADFASVIPLVAKVETSDSGQPVGKEILNKGIRYNFPAAGEETTEGLSDGYCFRITFAAGRLDRTYEMVKVFLQEEGYGDLPLPKNSEELRLFRLPPKLRHQLSLFGDNGYVHNPVKILFPVPAGRRGGLTVELYNEAHPDHLMRFYRLK
ncbi:MAG: hypothetical protein OTI34_16770 [Lewinella sp.]|nr:hypothetical protein [Lewinella sp.]